MKLGSIFTLGLSLLGGAAFAQTPGPTPATATPPIPAPQDIVYPGALTVAVDATDLTHGIFTIHETIPVAGPGPVVLTYPRWLPGAHSPGGSIDKVAGLIIRAGGQRLEWTRDPVDVTAFNVTPPPGAKTLDVDFQFLSPVSTREGRVGDDAGDAERRVDLARPLSGWLLHARHQGGRLDPSAGRVEIRHGARTPPRKRAAW